MKKFIILFIFCFPTIVFAQRGCCSHHGGVAGCGSNGRQICNDGTYSPTCTCTPQINYIYGCTNPNAYNYNSKANKDDGSCIEKVYGCKDSNSINYNPNANMSDGSCQYQKEIITEEEILYSTEIINGDEDSIKQKGENGKKEIKTRQIINENGDILSSDLMEEKVIVEPVTEILLKKDINGEENETNNLEKKDKIVSANNGEYEQENLTKTVDEEEYSLVDSVFPLTVVGTAIYFIFFRRK